jgi:hypothetical protein
MTDELTQVLTDAEVRALWDALRTEAFSDSERAEIDAIFSRQTP